MQESTSTRDIRKLRSEGIDVSSQKMVHMCIGYIYDTCMYYDEGIHSFEGGILWHFAIKKGRWHLVCQSYCGFPYYRILFLTILQQILLCKEIRIQCIRCCTYARIMQCSIYFIYAFQVVWLLFFSSGGLFVIPLFLQSQWYHLVIIIRTNFVRKICHKTSAAWRHLNNAFVLYKSSMYHYEYKPVFPDLDTPKELHNL